MDNKFWTSERKEKLVQLMTANPRVLNDFQIARKFKRTRYEIYQVFHAISAHKVSVELEYTDEDGRKIIRYSAAYARGLMYSPTAVAKGREHVN